MQVLTCLVGMPNTEPTWQFAKVGVQRFVHDLDVVSVYEPLNPFPAGLGSHQSKEDNTRDPESFGPGKVCPAL